MVLGGASVRNAFVQNDNDKFELEIFLVRNGSQAQTETGWKSLLRVHSYRTASKHEWIL